MSVAYEVAQILEEENFGDLWESETWVISVGEEPASPNQTVTVYDVPGSQPHYSAEIEYPSVQVRVRGDPGNGYLTAYSHLKAIKDKLAYDGKFTFDDVDFVFWCDGNEHWLMNDENHRPIFILNLRIQRSE